MKILVLNGPNINMLGIREPAIYGKETYKDLCNLIKKYGKENKIKIIIKQSNYEGELISTIHKSYFKKIDAIVINPAAYTHTSIAILDALKSVNVPFVEVHISDVGSRESFRQVSYTGICAEKIISGEGIKGYISALDYIKENLKK